MSLICENCGETTLEERHGDYEFKWPESVSRKPSTFRNADWLECTHCGIKMLSSALSERIEAKRYKLEGLLTPAEMRQMRQSLGLNQVQMAQRLHVGDKSYCRWENGQSIQSKAIDTLIRGAFLYPDMLESVETSRAAGASDITSRQVKRQRSAACSRMRDRGFLAKSGRSGALDRKKATTRRASAVRRETSRRDATQRVTRHPRRSTSDEPLVAA